MSINNSPEADIYVPMTREEAAYNNMSNSNNTAIEQTNQSQNDSEHNNNSSGSNMISNVLNEVNTFIDSLDSPPLFAAPPSSLPTTSTTDNVVQKDGSGAPLLIGAPKTNSNDMPPPPPSYEAATSSYSIADELNNLHIDRIHSDHGTGVECNICPPSSLTSLTPPQTASLTTITTASAQPQTALTKAEDDDKEDGGMINQSEKLFTSLSSRYQQHQEDQQQQVKPDSEFEDENHIGNVVIGASTTTESEEIKDNNDIIKASEELYNKILQEEQQQQAINVQNDIGKDESVVGNDIVNDNTAATDKVAEVTKASEELYNKINSNINSSDSITAMESYSVGGEESIDISVTATKNNNNNNNNSEKTSQFNWNKEVPRSQRRSSSRGTAATYIATAALPPSMPSNQVQRKNTATTSTPTDEPSSKLQSSSNQRVANPTTQKVLSPFSSKARRVIHTLETIKAEAQSSNNERFGLQNCRRVSLLLKVTSHYQQQEKFATVSDEDGLGRGEETDEDGYGPILYPALIDQDAAAAADGREGGNKEVKSSSQLMKHGEVILVNPNAFDEEDNEGNNKEGSESLGAKAKKRIAGRVTVETAKLVAEVVSLLLYFESIHLH